MSGIPTYMIYTFNILDPCLDGKFTIHELTGNLGLVVSNETPFNIINSFVLKFHENYSDTFDTSLRFD